MEGLMVGTEGLLLLVGTVGLAIILHFQMAADISAILQFQPH